MKSAVWVIMKKELARFFGDRRLMLSTVLLPGVMIFVMYQFMGQAIQSQLDQRTDSPITLEAVGMPDSVRQIFEGENIKIEEIPQEKIKETKDKIQNQELELFVVFSDDFDNEVSKYTVESGEEAPSAQIYYNSASNPSLGAYQLVTGLLDGYEGTLCNKFDVNPGEAEYDLATKEDAAGSMFASMLPMLLLIFLYSGCVAVAPESIAGEKERGTIATLLITPIRRGDIALGKIGALSVIALLSGVSSTVGTILSLPEMMRGEGGASESVSTNVYSVSDYLLLTVVILSTVLLLVTMISILSAYARTIKEAQTLVMPLMLVVMLVGISAMFGEDAKTEWQYYLIPMYNSVQCMVGIFSFKVVLARVALTVATNLAVTGVGVWILAKMFHSEEIMFS